jgi:hypothetical protein
LEGHLLRFGGILRRRSEEVSNQEYLDLQAVILRPEGSSPVFTAGKVTWERHLRNWAGGEEKMGRKPVNAKGIL